MKVSDNTQISLPIRNLIGIVGAVAIGVWAYFGVVETLNVHSTKLKLMENDLEKNTEFRIKWPRGEMGSLPADAEQFLLIEDSIVEIEKLIKDVDKITESLEVLKDKVRANGSYK